MKKEVKRKDNILKRFLALTAAAVCSFLFFLGIVVSKNNTERSLKGTEINKIDETFIINEVKNSLGELFK